MTAHSGFGALYDAEWERQRARDDVPAGHLPVHRWYLQHPAPWTVNATQPPSQDLAIMRAVEPTVPFYRFLYHTVGEHYLWGDRRRMTDVDLLPLIQNPDVHVMVLYKAGVPAGFYELQFDAGGQDRLTELNYFGLMPGFTGGGLGSFLLNAAVAQAGKVRVPLSVNTCSLDHRSALENYQRRGFTITREEDEVYPDPRLDGVIPATSAPQIPPATLASRTVL